MGTQSQIQVGLKEIKMDGHGKKPRQEDHGLRPVWAKG
jgi:hypothetical protein